MILILTIRIIYNVQENGCLNFGDRSQMMVLSTKGFDDVMGIIVKY
ncbi:hypothetical protein SAMN05660235_01105 [Sporolituus thermophilus DSM 23256]|uniref:Uncharacterized protein n=1 Tax=Sporolituus thermophilus DSM 23256 TaxID=1123285 RepID=A0A1G7JXC7_9FIRM|nr:hypothetical protein SAMN05660235_01105 [Sporolituus thermophilus DSM 23256]